MIPYNDITAWSVDHPWPTREQVEQDLLLSQALSVIANDDLLSEELTVRGGTAFHKLFLPSPRRYSEDLDYVRSSAGGIGPIMKRLTELGEKNGFNVRTRIGQFPKVFWHTTAQTGTPLKIKIEIDTFERSPALPFLFKHHDVDTRWLHISSDIRTFQPEELVATKLRALYQRSKGRDLYDIWLALEVLGLEPDRIIDAFAPYQPKGMTSKKAIANLNLKLEDASFQSDLSSLIASGMEPYNAAAAGSLVIKELLLRL